MVVPACLQTLSALMMFIYCLSHHSPGLNGIQQRLEQLIPIIRLHVMSSTEHK